VDIPLPQDEALRLDALRRYAILDTPPDPGFDRITRLAAKLLHAPIALISLVAADRQWFKSSVGLDLTETPRAVAFCAHTILQDSPMVVADATADARFAQNPFVTGPEGLRFYAGVPLKSRDGYNLGTLSVLDRMPRTPPPEDLDVLQDLAGMVVDELELRLALIGCATRPESEAARSLSDGWLRIPDGDGAMYLRRSSSAAPWRVAAAVHDQGRATEWRAEYGKAETGLPRSVRLAGTGGRHFDLRLDLSQVTVNDTLGPEVFRVQIPRGAQPVTLEELRAAGPLAERASSK
jgi:GAF domain-containing protein